MRPISTLALTTLTLALATAAAAQTPEVTLTRYECGAPRVTNVNERFSDTFAFPGLKVDFVFSCYLIKHGSDYMIWDTGFAIDSGATAPKVALTDQVAKSGVKPEQVKYVGISHMHGDHIGGAAGFPAATLLIGKGDWDVLTAPKLPEGVNNAPLKHWVSGGGKVEPLANDKDVFGDGTVVILNTPGHTPGHHSLLVRLPQTGAVILSGDAAHFRENYEASGAPWFNHDRSQTVASLERIKKLAANLKATVVLQHDARDVSKLPVAPDSAK